MKIGDRFYPNGVLSLQLNMKAVRVKLSLRRLFQGGKIYSVFVSERIFFQLWFVSSCLYQLVLESFPQCVLKQALNMACVVCSSVAMGMN